MSIALTELLQENLSDYYLHIKFIHVFSVMIWAWSTAVAYGWYVKGAFLKWAQSPDNPTTIQRRNWAIEQFDRGVIMEHVAFPVVIVTGLLLYLLAGWNTDSAWLVLKLLVVTVVFIPIEIVDYHLSHFGGNKTRLRKRGELEKYEKSIQHHWLFLRVTTPLVIVFVPVTVYLAIVKPAL